MKLIKSIVYDISFTKIDAKVQNKQEQNKKKCFFCFFKQKK